MQLVTKKRLPTATSNQSPQANALQHNTGLRRWQEEKGKSTTRHSTNRCRNQANALRTHPRQPATPHQSNTNVLNERGASVTLIPRSALQGSANSKPSASSQILRIHQFAIVRFLTENPGPDREGENDGSGAIIQGRITYLTFLMAMMKKQPMIARAMAVGKAKL